MMKIGFIGLGVMGKPMAKNLLKAGYRVTIFANRKEVQQELAEAGAEVGSSAKDVAQKTEVIITMLPNSPDVKQVILGKDGVLEGAREGMIIIDMSSIAPLASQEIAKKLKEKGVEMLDAPVSGGEAKAIDGTLAIMLGGPEAVFERVKDILAVMGSSVVRVGEIGSGNVTKLANQIIVALNIAAMSEAMVLATKAGVDPENVFQAIGGGSAGSSVLDKKFPRIKAGDFKPGFRLELHIKDLLNALDTGDEIDVPLPLTNQIFEIMQTLKEEGKSKEDHTGIIKYYEKIAGVEVRG
ncbi:2-hydroxy-3-oxopropionate reductase [Alkaliphilus metalliredigens QYMF]|uniref:2-hydroxy-3-oxopropionate reductase n=1 Tax=Alkaliphilus metalliredigens (strain QYMF) TaxID=293826 RepID=A6TSE1_ALKMQ|nr:2-hydroxy-3-oxopropionate reductase [Alkaliphilus metalliredigens]ABR49109.1 2-hydroxy-3-oxopropionate reductase [Alkaliphilus metalliredigens QYMF]